MRAKSFQCNHTVASVKGRRGSWQGGAGDGIPPLLSPARLVRLVPGFGNRRDRPRAVSRLVLPERGGIMRSCLVPPSGAGGFSRHRRSVPGPLDRPRGSNPPVPLAGRVVRWSPRFVGPVLCRGHPPETICTHNPLRDRNWGGVRPGRSWRAGWPAGLPAAGLHSGRCRVSDWCLTGV